MLYHERQYELYVILGGPGAKPWVGKGWASVADALAPLIGAARGRPAVRSLQYRPRPGTAYFDPIPFGRLAWGDKSASRWIHVSDGMMASGDSATFQSAEVWAPSWTICEREDRPPDIFFQMRDEAGRFGGKPAAGFGPVLILAVATDFAGAISGSAREAAATISDKVGSVLRVRCERPWGYAWGTLGFGNAIQDLPYGGLFKPEPWQVWPISPAMLEGAWEIF